MRIDKFLKVSRILKRRTVSKELALNDRVEINGKPVKPSHEVKAGDTVAVRFGSRLLEVRVLSVQEPRKKQEASEMYEIIRESRIAQPEAEWYKKDTGDSHDTEKDGKEDNPDS